MLEQGTRRGTLLTCAVVVLISLAGEAAAQSAQGWSDADRDTFYTTRQGSHMMPYSWFKALRRLDIDEAFGADQLQRYGYLRNDSPSNVAGLPIGFVIEGTAVSGDLGMTCAACHTGQLEYQKDGVTHTMRLDGAPASADFQQFLADLTEASRQTLLQPARFDRFAKDVFDIAATPKEELRTDFKHWVDEFGAFMDQSLPRPPKPAWGPGRLDAFGMIFNRVAGLDLQVHDNIKPADAPVSYPFLWNASRQDHTQWNGGVPNGLYIQGLARNTGEVFGVFAKFNPTIRFQVPRRINFQDNSANFAGLQTLEETIVKLQPPRWPFELKSELVEQGKALFVQNCSKGCHEKKDSLRPPHAWVTPVVPVGTDSRTATNARRTGDPGIYKGALLPPLTLERFKNPAAISDILAKSVLGSVRDSAPFPPEWEKSGIWRAIRLDLEKLLPGRDIKDLTNPVLLTQLWEQIDARLDDMYAPTSTEAAYESRVLDGIWATAPYLHNGSVPNLWELLKPPGERVTSFKVGSRMFDPVNVGYVIDQSPFASGTFTVDPANANGNGNLGHNYGTGLTEDERWAIVEYLKSL